ncbi:DNA mismatch repair protein MutS [Aeoliella sp. ICT_H6.2]|uniref:DNA mismatch repair protein MutS n=1 Tax=Aeoliella straminimaris TaxID=2954799 RepID=A0A9X2JHI6_9BACT|nr:DNA mismatch repair protein MutS [Aeoliella straminimaris]MCO6042944.1 DNA mismatch repair protein MutS [Aeoliella straminimaris]
MALSPMMQQYHQAKETAGDALLLFRMGDFYELFYDDAKTAARVLGLSLTSRDKGENPVAMAGFPHHQLDQYLAKIISAGYRAAICEQMEDPKQAKGIVKRDITRVVSRGTVTDDSLLDPSQSNYLAALVLDKDAARVGLAWVDLSTGVFMAAQLAANETADQLARIAPTELVVSDDQREELPRIWTSERLVTTRPPWAFGQKQAMELLAKHFGTNTLEGFGFDEENAGDRQAMAAAGAILEYLTETQKTDLSHISTLVPLREGQSLEIDAATWRSLEITQTLRDGRREGTLLDVLDRTTTPMGARRLGEWLAHPLVDTAAINARLDAVAELVAETKLTAAIREALKNIYDLQRLIARVTTGRAGPRDLSCVGRTLAALPALKAKLTGRSSSLLAEIESRVDLCPELRSKLEGMLADDCPLVARDGGFIRVGAHEKLDELRELMSGGKQWMANYQAAEIERSGIPSMKVGFNKVFGYYLEVTHAHRDKVPEEYIRKQTLKNAERYITPELKEYEEKVLSAEERVLALELELFAELRELTAQAGPRLLSTAAALADLDALASLAEVARARDYVRPEIAEEPVLEIEAGRHPVVEATEPAGTFVPNDTRCAGNGVGNEDREARGAQHQDSSLVPNPSILLITGPNMAGKSTYIRQTALLVLMAQVGSFVPARRARIGVADRLFARVGASDELARGQSTFMVEMTEAARILNTATHRSVVVLDEIGRGTSTYDGLSLAWSIVEYLHESIGSRTLFATHYHELTELADQLVGVANLNVMVREHFGKIVFLHQIVPGSADRSYGIHVAQLAGVPKAVSSRAEEILAELEAAHRVDEAHAELPEPHTKKKASKNGSLQLTLFETAEHPLVSELRELDLNSMTPLEAMAVIDRMKKGL